MYNKSIESRDKLSCCFKGGKFLRKKIDREFRIH
jgi:hypothetical protein